MISDDEKYFNLGTLKRDGSYVDTPVWFAMESLGDAYYVLANVNLGRLNVCAILILLGLLFAIGRDG